MRIFVGFMACVLAFGLSGDILARDGAQTKAADGVVHVLNPAQPAKGTVPLKVERTLLINPYDQPDVEFKYFSSLRGREGAVILYSGAEFHRFGPKGEYLGRFSREGQGPGEFAGQSGSTPYFLDDRIWVAGGMKLAEFGLDGKFLHERTLNTRPSLLVDATHYLAERTDRGKDGTPESMALILVRFAKESLSDAQEVEFIRGTDLGSIRNKNGRGGLVDPWGTPRLCYGYDPASKKVYAAINTEYKIFVKSLRGDTLSVIENEHDRVKVDRKDIGTMMSFAKSEAGKWIMDAYPDRYVVMNSIQSLPNGCLLVRRVTGPKQTVMDVFGPDGKFLYVLLPPEGMTFDTLTFHARGFSRTETSGDFQVYADYRVTNLPEVFGK